MKKSKQTLCSIVFLFVLLSLLCSISAEEEKVSLEPSEATTVNPLSENVESKFSAESKNESKPELSNHDQPHDQDDHHLHRHHHQDVKPSQAAVDKADLITVKKGVHTAEEGSPPPPWDPLSTLGKPPPTRPPYRHVI
jgi:hypothetical protein